jgi:hypothetical protein
MKKQVTQRWQSSLLAAIAIVLAFGAFSGAAIAQENKSINARYGSRDPRTCEDTKAPARGAITAALALKYLNCQMEYVSGSGDLYLVENVKVEVGGGIPYAAIMGQRSLSEIDVKHPVYPIRGSLLRYQCQNRLTAARVPDANCTTYNEPKATGYCYKTTFADWRCYMNDPAAGNASNIRHDVPPPKGKNNAAEDKTMPNDKPAGTNPKQTVNPKDTKQTAGTKDAPDAAERNEDGFPKPDFSEMEKYFEIVKYDYNPVDGRVTFVVKAKKQTNIFRWYLNAYDADGVKISETSFNGNVVSPEIGEPTRIYSFAPNEKDIKRVARIAITRKLD